MIIDEAIKILQRSASNGIPRGETSFNDAVKLGIEALKRINDIRSPEVNYSGGLLPSETEE